MCANEQAPTPSRRSVIAGLGTATAAEVPAIGLAATADDHPHRELLKLGRRYQDLETRLVAADAYLQQCYNAAEEPQPSEVLRHRLEDHVFGQQLPMLGTCRIGLCSDAKFNDFYSAEEMKRLRCAPPPIRPGPYHRAKGEDRGNRTGVGTVAVRKFGCR